MLIARTSVFPSLVTTGAVAITGASSWTACATPLLANRSWSLEMEFDTTLNFPKHILAESSNGSTVQHNSGTFVVQSPGTAAIRGSGYLMAAPVSKSKSVAWRRR